MLHLPSTVSPLEALWVIGAFFGASFSLAALGVYGRAAHVVVKAIRAGLASYSGPRWKYTFGSLCAMTFFLPGWVAFLLTGLIAASFPEPTRSSDASMLDLLFELFILAGEISMATGQVAIVVVWWLVRRATVFVPPAYRTPTPPTERVREST